MQKCCIFAACFVGFQGKLGMSSGSQMLPMPFAQSPLWFLLAASPMWIQLHFHKYHKCSCCTWLLWISLDRMNHRSLPSSSCRNWTIEKFQLQHPKQSLHGRRRVSGFTFSVTFSVVHCTSRCAPAGAGLIPLTVPAVGTPTSHEQGNMCSA
jgi:hypothetical protein